MVEQTTKMVEIVVEVELNETQIVMLDAEGSVTIVDNIDLPVEQQTFVHLDNQAACALASLLDR